MGSEKQNVQNTFKKEKAEILTLFLGILSLSLPWMPGKTCYSKENKGRRTEVRE